MKNSIFLFLIGLLFFSACGGSSKPAEQEEAAPMITGNPAIDGLTQEIRNDPENASLYAQRGQVFLENQGYDEAIIDFTFAIQFDSTNIDYYHILADTYLDYFKSRKALAVMKEAAQKFPDHLPTLIKLSEFQLILKKYEDSMKTIDQVLKKDPQNAMAYFMFGMNFKDQGDTIRAINSFQKAVEFDADIVDAWLNLGQLYAGIGDPLAARYFDNALRVAPEDITALHAKADYLSSQNDLEGAVATYRRIVGVDPSYREAYFNSGLIYLDMDSIEAANKNFDLSVKVSPTYIKGYYFRGLSYEMLGNKEAAKNDYEQALRMAPNYEKAQEGLERVKDAG